MKSSRPGCILNVYTASVRALPACRLPYSPHRFESLEKDRARIRDAATDELREVSITEIRALPYLPAVKLGARLDRQRTEFSFERWRTPAEFVATSRISYPSHTVSDGNFAFGKFDRSRSPSSACITLSSPYFPVRARRKAVPGFDLEAIRLRPRGFRRPLWVEAHHGPL